MRQYFKTNLKLKEFIRISILSCIAAAMLAVSGCSLLPAEEAVLAPPLKEPPKVTYETETVKKGNIEKVIRTPGSFVSIDNCNIFFKYKSGRLKKIYVTYGQEVKKGTLLAELDSEGIEGDIQQKQIALEKAQIAYNQLVAGQQKDAEATQYSLEKARYDAELVRLQLADLERDMAKVDEVYAKYGTNVNIKDIYPNIDVESLKSQIEQKKIALQKAELECQRLTSVQSDDSAINKAYLDVEAAQLQLNSSLADLEKSRVYAPIDGYIDFIDKVDEGSVINAYSIIMRIADPTRPLLQYTGDKASEFNQGAKVKVEIKSKQYDGEVVMTPSNAPKDASDQVKKSVYIKVSDLPSDVTLGSQAVAILSQAKAENTIVISKNLVQKYLGRNIVKVMVNGIPTDRDIEVGIETDTQYEVLKGLEVGDEVVVR